jgi:hypothetical protein
VFGLYQREFVDLGQTVKPIEQAPVVVEQYLLENFVEGPPRAMVSAAFASASSYACSITARNNSVLSL